MTKHTKFVVRVGVWEHTFLQEDKGSDVEDLVEMFNVAVDMPTYATASALASYTAKVGRVLATAQPVPRQ